MNVKSLPLVGVLLAASVVPARAELVFFATGRNLSVKSHRVDGDTIVLTIDDTPLGLYEIHTQRNNKADNSLGADIAKKLGKVLAARSIVSTNIQSDEQFTNSVRIASGCRHKVVYELD